MNLRKFRTKLIEFNIKGCREPASNLLPLSLDLIAAIVPLTDRKAFSLTIARFCARRAAGGALFWMYSLIMY